jgi:glycosyltransferase involved in cell wall biosynthesis
MRVMQVITGLGPAGAEKIVLELSSGLKKAGADVKVVSLSPLPEDTSVVDALKKNGVDTEFLGFSRLSFHRIFGLKRLIAGFAPDIVHSHLFHANIASRLAAGGRPLVSTVHIADRRPSRLWQFPLDRLTLSRNTTVTAVSEAARNYYCAKTGIPPEKVSVIHNGVTVPEALSPARQSELRREWGVEGCEKVIGSFGRLNSQKGYDALLNLPPELSKLIPPGRTWGLVILGEGPERKNLESLAARAPKNIIVRLPGFSADASSRASAFDLFVMPSRYEGFGLALAEAMCLGLPCVASNADSLPGLLKNYPNGATADFFSPDTRPAAETIARMAERPKSHPCVIQTVEGMVSEYRALYERLVRRASV